MSITITLKEKGLDIIASKLQNINSSRDWADGLNKIITEVNKQAIKEVPVLTSQLQKSHILEPAKSSTLKARVYTDKEYAVPVHEGHRLVAWGRDTGKHIKANPWMERAVENTESKIESILNNLADDIINNI